MTIFDRSLGLRSLLGSCKGLPHADLVNSLLGRRREPGINGNNSRRHHTDREDSRKFVLGCRPQSEIEKVGGHHGGDGQQHHKDGISDEVEKSTACKYRSDLSDRLFPTAEGPFSDLNQLPSPRDCCGYAHNHACNECPVHHPILGGGRFVASLA